jgi:hypothetical protein
MMARGDLYIVGHDILTTMRKGSSKICQMYCTSFFNVEYNSCNLYFCETNEA